MGREEGKKSMPRKREGERKGEREEKIKNYNIIAQRIEIKSSTISKVCNRQLDH